MAVGRHSSGNAQVAPHSIFCANLHKLQNRNIILSEFIATAKIIF